MKKSHLLLSFTLLFILCGCEMKQLAEQKPTGLSGEIVQEPEQVRPVTEPSSEVLEPDFIQTILDEMTLEEKVGQLFLVRTPEEYSVEDIQQYHLGGLVLFGEDTDGKTANDLIQTIQSYQDAADIPLIVAADEEGGTVVRFSSNPKLCSQRFPSAQELYAAGGMEAVCTGTREKDIFLRAMGVNVNLGPVADVSTDSADYIYYRTLGQDAEATAKYITTVTRQMAQDGMGSVLKHFPGYGNNVDTHTGISIDTRFMESFERADFLPFRAGIEAGGSSTAVMVSHNIMTCVDDTLPASLSPAVHTLLRETLDFDGVIITDDLYMDAVAAYAEDGMSAVMALQAGNDLVATTDYTIQIPAVIEAVRNGTLQEEQINMSCTRVLKWKQALGLLSEIE